MFGFLFLGFRVFRFLFPGFGVFQLLFLSLGVLGFGCLLVLGLVLECG